MSIRGSVPRRIVAITGRIALLLLVIIFAIWFFGIRMPERNSYKAAQLTETEVTLRGELVADVKVLAGEIGERNLQRYAQLTAAANFIERSFTAAGFKPQRISYEVRGRLCHNIEVEIAGARPGIFVVGAHYDSVSDCPGANDNGSGVAALLALARWFAGKSPGQTLRFVAFVNEEMPYFLSGEMGSLVYAKRCRERGDRVSGMISLETMGYFSDAPGSQQYPAAGLGLVYPNTGNFIGFVSNLQSRALLRKAIAIFRKQRKLPAEGAALPAVVPGISWSDHWAFWQCGYPAIMITDTAPFRYPHYHESSDTPDKLDYDRFALAVSGMESVIEELTR